MRRREFVELAIAALAAGVTGACASSAEPRRGAASAGPTGPLDAAAFRAERRHAKISFGKIAYLERGAGAAALFMHGLPLNSFQWRGAIERLSAHRRCVAPDFMGLGYTEVPESQALTADAQTAMLAALLDKLEISSVDVVASDSGGAIAQLFMTRYPGRVRTALLTNCDVEPDSPPASIKPILDQARAGTLADTIAKWLVDKALARSAFGAAVFRDPAQFADETIEYYFAPVVSSPLRKAQFHAYHLALEPNPLAGVEAALKRSAIPTRIVWGASDDVFLQSDADYLDRTLPKSRGIRRVPGAKLFFQEEFPDLLAEEAKRLWGVAA